MDNKDIRIGIIGMGHVGLTTALGLAELGWNVMGTDQDEAKMAQLHRGQSPFYEPGLQELLGTHLETQRFVPDADVGKVMRWSSVLFVCVGTPQREDGSSDLSQVENVTRTIARNLNGYKLVVEKSTVPVRTADWIRRTLSRYRNGPHDFDVASNPEFLQEGSAVQGVLHPDRVVIGVDTDRARDILMEIYRALDCPKMATDLRTAEIIKHAANAFLATKVSFINMIADLCEATEADISQISRGIGLDPRIGPSFLKAGIGFGGYCLPKDLRAFIHIAREHGVDLSLLREVERINEARVYSFLRKVREALWVLEAKTVAVLGLSFKADTDDIREAPSLNIIRELQRAGARVRLYDPQAMQEAKKIIAPNPPDVVYCDSALQAAAGAHALALVTEWEEFRQLDLTRLREVMEVPIIIDGRNIFDTSELREAGFEYFSIGRP